MIDESDDWGGSRFSEMAHRRGLVSHSARLPGLGRAAEALQSKIFHVGIREL